jgi:hypothetical protein
MPQARCWRMNSHQEQPRATSISTWYCGTAARYPGLGALEVTFTFTLDTTAAQLELIQDSALT